MGHIYGWTLLSICTSLQWSVIIDPCSAYYSQAAVDGYLFTIPDSGDQEKRTQVDAQTWCAGNKSKLLDISSKNLQSSVVTFINNAINQNQMTGNIVITNGKRFSSSKFIWVNGIPWMNHSEHSGSSLQIYGQDSSFVCSYGYLNSSLSGNVFVADAPTVSRGYVCEGPSFCSGGFKSNERCYKSYSETLSWFGARNRCLDGGGDLASFEFIVDAQGLSALNSSGWNQLTTYWVGLQRLKWTWQGSNSDVKCSQWSDGHPVYTTNTYQDCLCLNPNNPYYDWKWIECDCSQRYHVVCSTDPPATPSASTFKTPETSTVLINTATASFGLGNATAKYSKPSTMKSLLSTDVAFQSTRNRGKTLGIGIGVGTGGALIIAAIIIVVFIVFRKRGCPRKTTNPPDVTLHEIGPHCSHYAEIPKSSGYGKSSPPDANSNQLTPTVVYSDLEILTGFQNSEGKDSVSLIRSKTATLPPPINHKGTTHFTEDGLEYAEVKDVRM